MNVADHARKLNTVRKKKTAHFFTIRKARFIKGEGLVIKNKKQPTYCRNALSFYSSLLNFYPTR